MWSHYNGRYSVLLPSLVSTLIGVNCNNQADDSGRLYLNAAVQAHCRLPQGIVNRPAEGSAAFVQGHCDQVANSRNRRLVDDHLITNANVGLHVRAVGDE